MFIALKTVEDNEEENMREDSAPPRFRSLAPVRISIGWCAGSEMRSESLGGEMRATCETETATQARSRAPTLRRIHRGPDVGGL